MLKTVSSITNAIGALNYKGTWNASTNTPTLASGSGTKGDYYVVSVAGSTSLDGISNWGIGDWAVFNGSVWQRVEGGADLNGVNLSVTGNSDLGNIRVATNTISSTNTNGNIVVSPNGTGQVVVNAGAVGSPTIAPTGDLNTGLYFPGADQVGLSAGGSAKVYASTTGVGISTVTPNAPLSMASSYKQDGSAGSSFDVFIPITSIMFKQADASTLGNAGSNGNAELALAAGTDILLGALGAVGVYTNSNDSRLTSPVAIAPTGYVVAARVVVVGDANQASDQDQVYILARSTVNNGTTWYDFTMATGYRHQFYNARWLMVGKWMPLDTDYNATHGGRCQFGVRAASSVGLIYTSISVQIAYVKI